MKVAVLRTRASVHDMMSLLSISGLESQKVSYGLRISRLPKDLYELLTELPERCYAAGSFDGIITDCTRETRGSASDCRAKTSELTTRPRGFSPNPRHDRGKRLGGGFERSGRVSYELFLRTLPPSMSNRETAKTSI